MPVSLSVSLQQNCRKQHAQFGAPDVKEILVGVNSFFIFDGIERRRKQLQIRRNWQRQYRLKRRSHKLDEVDGDDGDDHINYLDVLCVQDKDNFVQTRKDFKILNQGSFIKFLKAPAWLQQLFRGNDLKVTKGEGMKGVQRENSNRTVRASGGKNRDVGNDDSKSNGSRSLKWHGWRWKHCISGAVAGGIVEAAMFPLDTLKTRLQTSTNQPVPILKRLNGFKGVYSGCVGGVIGTALADAVYFGVYEPMKETCLSAMPEHFHTLAHAISAASASLVASVVRVPSEVLKQRMQAGQGFKSAINVFHGIMRNYGIRGLYNGTVPLLLRDLPFNTIEFAIYENLKVTTKKIKAARSNTEIDWKTLSLTQGEAGRIGALAGMFTAAITTPMDVLKTRLMVQATGARYSNIADAAIKIVREEGVLVLFQGLVPRLLWISFGGCIFFSALEGMEALLNKQKPVYSGLRGGAKAP